MYYKTMRGTKAPQSPISDSHHGLSINRQRLSLRGRHISARRDCGGFNGTARESIGVRCDSRHTCGAGRHAERTIEWCLKQARGDFAQVLGRDHRSIRGAWRRLASHLSSVAQPKLTCLLQRRIDLQVQVQNHRRSPAIPQTTPGPSTQGTGLLGASPPDFLSSRPRLSAQWTILGASTCPFSDETRPRHA